MVVPATTPVTTPEREPTVATAGVLLVQVPPGVVLASVVVLPVQTDKDPDIAPTEALTVTVTVDAQPVDISVYVIVAVPVDTPVTTPDEEPTVATEGVPLVHTPPGEEEVSVPVPPGHSAVGPVMPGNGLTVIDALPVMVAVQPVVTFVATTV